MTRRVSQLSNAAVVEEFPDDEVWQKRRLKSREDSGGAS